MLPPPGSLAYTLPPTLLALAAWTAYTILLLRRDWRNIGRNVAEWERKSNGR